jgi:uncharacterized membrane protein YgdD (TMEM256/DUF423 family)
MRETSALKLRIASGLGFAAVALGAFGAHGLKPRLAAGGMLETWETAALYHLVHAAVLLALALGLPQARWAFRFFVAGVALFSGSLYFYALAGWKFLALVTPLGGAALLAGWAALFLGVRKALEERP